DGTLEDRFRECREKGLPGIPRDELLDYLEEAAKGLDFLNQPRRKAGGGRHAGVQHLDVKPQNLLLVGGSVKVGDFGLARVLGPSRPGHGGGRTWLFARPEVFDGKASSRSDQYSLAVTYCYLRGGRPPFTGSEAELVRGHVHKPPDLTMLPEEE